MEFKDDEIKRLQLAAEAEEKKRFLHNVGSLETFATMPSKETVPEPTSEPVKEDLSSLKQIRTFQGDVASALKQQNESLVSIQKRQSVKNEIEKAKTEEPSSGIGKTILLVISIILFIGLGGVGGYLTYNHFKTITAPLPVAIPENRFIGVNETKNINSSALTRDSFISLIKSERNGIPEDNPSQITQIELRKGEGETAALLHTSEFILLLQAKTPSSLGRAFDQNFMLGQLGNIDRSTFILIKLKSFEQAYPGMLEWEKDIEEDLGPIFIMEEELSKLSPNKNFEDITITNKDARVLKDSEGKIVLLYTFIDNQELLITDNEDSMKTIISAISAQKLSR
jgi:hypothetical protein